MCTINKKNTNKLSILFTHKLELHKIIPHTAKKGQLGRRAGLKADKQVPCAVYPFTLLANNLTENIITVVTFIVVVMYSPVEVSYINWSVGFGAKYVTVKLMFNLDKNKKKSYSMHFYINAAEHTIQIKLLIEHESKCTNTL